MTKTCDVWISEADHSRLMDHLYPGDQDEHGAILRAGIVEFGDGLRLLIRDIALAEPGINYVGGQFGYRALKPTFIHKHITGCRDERLAYLAVHNHDCDDWVDFSTIDLESHERGYPALRDIGKGVPVGALVYGRTAVEADIWLSDGTRAKLGEYRIIGSSIVRRTASPRKTGKSGVNYDRQVRMFGKVGQEILAEAKVAIVGLGGVGSLVAEYAARLGVGELLLIDPDVIDDTNLSRVVGAIANDVKSGRLKTDIAANLVLAANPSAKVKQFPVDVLNADAADALKSCDYIFLCADSMRARLLVNAITHQYFVPMVQLGAKITTNEAGTLVDAMSAIRTVRPGEGCLWCNGFIPSGILALEAKSDEERKAQAYGTHEPNPSVITMNAVAASQGINDFLFDYLGLRESNGDWRYEHAHFLGRKTMKVVPRRELECSECVRRYGRGDAIGLPGVMARPVPRGDSQTAVAGVVPGSHPEIDREATTRIKPGRNDMMGAE